MSKSQKLADYLKGMRTDLAIKQEKKKTLEEKMTDLEKKILDLNIDVLNETVAVLKKLSSNQRNAAKKRLEDLGTEALKYSMGNQYRMEIEIDDTRKRPQAYMYRIDESTGLKTDPLEENGGGVVDIINIALRIIVIQANTPNIDGPIILDEPFKMVSKEYIPMLSDFLRKISNDFGRQIIMVTHNEYLAECCDTKIDFNAII